MFTPTPDSGFRETFVTKYRWWILAALLAIIVTFFSVFIIRPRQTIGDTYDLANAFFAALAFAGVIFTIVLQSEELRLQRHEIEQTQHEMRQQAEMLFLAAYLEACRTSLEGLKTRDPTDFRHIGPWDVAAANLVTYIDALRERLAKRGFAELITIPKSEAYRQRIRRIRDYVHGRIEQCPKTKQDNRLEYIRQTRNAAMIALEATLHFMGATVGDDDNIAPLIRGVLGTLQRPIEDIRTDEESVFNANMEKCKAALVGLNSICT